MTNRIGSEIRGAALLGQHATMEYRALQPNQPLVLTREPGNPRDSNAVIARTMMLVPCGYIAKEHAALIAPDMDRGIVWLCKVTAARRTMSYPQWLWKEDGRALKFKRFALAYGADERLVDCVLQGKYMEDEL